MSPQPQPAPHAERTRGADGKEYWKLICFCGKHLLAPAEGPHKQGRCPQCSQRLIFPVRERHITTGPLPIIPAFREESRRTVERIQGADRHDSSARIKPGQSAADSAAERLRPSRRMQGRASDRPTGLISAWPPAATGPRMLAGFVDITAAATGWAMLLIFQPHLPGFCATMLCQAIFALLLFELNDGVGQWISGGSLGRKLAVIVLMDVGGSRLPPAKILLRPLLKLALFPGWILLFLDDDRRAFHDRILGTRVLKGRGIAKSAR